MKLRSYLLILAAGTLLPLIILAVVGAIWFAARERQTFQRGAMERTRALVTALDSELDSSITTLNALATSRHLDSDDLRAFHEEATRVLKSQPAWLTISLAAPSAQQVVNPLRPFGSEFPMTQERASFDQVLRTRQPAIGHLAVGQVTEQHEFSVRVPVTRNGVTKYVLSAVVKPLAIYRLLAPQRLPPDWVGVILDGNERIVARTIEPEKTVGQLASESLRAALAHSPEGWFQGSTVEGWEVYTPYNRSAFSGWTVAMGIPAAAVDAASRLTMWNMAAGIIGAGLLALLFSLLLSRRISAPITELAAAAQAVGRGEPPNIPSTTGVEEVGELAGALQDAATALREREETQERLAAIVHASGDAIIGYTPDAAVIAWNPAAERLFGHTAEEMSGQSVDVLVPPDRADEPARFFEAVRQGETVQVETVRLRKDGSPIDVALSLAPIRGSDRKVRGVSAIVRDITRRKQAEKALRESEQRFVTLAEVVPQFVWITDADGNVEYFNRRWYDYTGTTPQEMSGDGWAQVLHPDDRERTLASWQGALRAGGPIELEYRLRGADGRCEWFLTRGVPVRDASGSIARWFGTCTNIDAQKRLEDALREADRRKDEFLAMLGHELRNPLGIIGNATHILRRLVSSEPKVQELREMIERQVVHTSRMLDDLLDVSRITRGKMQLNKERWNLTDIIRQTAEDYHGALDERNVSLEANLPRQAIWIWADRTRIAQAVGNLLDNAGKFSKDGGTVTVKLEARDDRTATLSVIDTGIGMEPRMLRWIFEPFSQGEQSLDRSRGGLGLGLALVKGIVELHGGDITASSQGPGHGAVFTIRLPIEKTQAPRAPSLIAVADGSQARRVLVIEDNPVAAGSMQMLLEQAGHTVEVARSGPEGVEAARRFRPEVVLCDIGLPGMDGYAVAEALRRQITLKGICIVAVSGYAQDERRARNARFDGYLKKPVDFDELEELFAGFEAQPASSAWSVKES